MALGSCAKRNGLRNPLEKTSWHFVPAGEPAGGTPPTLHRAVPEPVYGLPAGIPPVSVTRTILPASLPRSCGQLRLWAPESPTVT